MEQKRQIHISFCFSGIYALAMPENRIIEQIDFPRDVSKVINEMDLCSQESVSGEEKKLLQKIAKNPQYKDCDIVFEVKKKGYDYLFPNKCGDYIRNTVVLNLCRKDSDFLVDLSVGQCEGKSKEKDKKIDLVIILSSAIGDIEKSVNALFLHAKDIIELNNPYLKEEQNLNTEEKYIKYIEKNADKVLENLGDKATKETIKNYICELSGLLKQKEKLKKQIEILLEKETPTMLNLIGVDLCAKYLRHAGGLRRLAFFPASTIQVLGAEKALFRHLKGKGLSPKYGIIYMSSYVMGAKAKNKGKVARLLAIKVSLASRMDLNKNTGWVGKIKKDFEDAIGKI